MVTFPNAKINLGLRILRRRPDGYHDIATIMLPIGWCDILEIVPANGNGSFRQTGIALDCPSEKNLVLKALRALEADLGQLLPPLDIVLEKHLPFGAGIGGGSADAAFTLTAVDGLLGLGLGSGRLESIAARVGADCPFFIHNVPALATGIGDVLEPVDATVLNGKHLVIAKPLGDSVSTAQAYAGVVPRKTDDTRCLTEALCRWDGNPVLANDFEPSVMAARPAIARLKQFMTSAGAEYAAMSGSGAAVFGIFGNAKMAENAFHSLGEIPKFMQQLQYEPV